MIPVELHGGQLSQICYFLVPCPWHCAVPRRPMSSAKRTLRRVIREWLDGSTAAPLLLRQCEVCGEKSWRPLVDTIRGVTIDARLPGDKRADAILTNAKGEIELVIQLEGGSK